MATEIDDIRRRLAAATSADWKRLQHHIEDEDEFSAHAKADVAYLLAAIETARARAAALEKALGALVDREPIGFNTTEDLVCGYCGRDPFPFGAGHKIDCPIVAARQLLATDPTP